MAKVKKAETIENRQAESDRRGNDRRKQQMPVASERRKVQRRRQIDPTTCERDYTDDEVEFMQALDAYKRRSGRMFPTCSEILEVIRDMGYVRMTPASIVPAPSEEPVEVASDACSADLS